MTQNENEPELSKSSQEILRHIDRLRELVVTGDFMVQAISEEFHSLRTMFTKLQKKEEPPDETCEKAP